MSQEGAARLRLKPRKAPAARGREPSPGREPPRRRQTLTEGCSWLEKEDLRECEKPWVWLLKDIGFQCKDWQSMPGFPEFSGKSSEEKNLQKEVVFTVGMRDFQWVPFPSFCKEKHLKSEDLHSHQPTRSQSDHLQTGQGQADEGHSLPSAAEKTLCVATTDQAKNTVGDTTKGVSELDANPKSCKLTQHRSSAPQLALPQSSAKAVSCQQRCRGTAQNSGENRNGRKELQIQTHQGKILFGQARHAPTEKRPPLVSAPGTESSQEKTESQSEGSSTLDSCPMCLMRFSGTLSQLDIDGHLARCLSESADDVMW